jgi:hypothetical protein
MKIFKKRKPIKKTGVHRIPFEQIVSDVLEHYKDNIIYSKETKDKVIQEIVKRIREQLPD